MATELVVVDNASTDGTAEFVQSLCLPNMPVVYLHEPRCGKSYAYNTGMAQSHGAVFLCTDDDVRPPENWIEGMCRPIINGSAGAVAGGFVTPSHLIPKWLRHSTLHGPHDSSYMRDNPPREMFGLNMAFSRAGFEKVGGFDTSIGAGALGYAEDTLFSWRLVKAGFRLALAEDVRVEHHYDLRRLTRENLLKRIKQTGRTDGYLAHHWHHDRRRLCRIRLQKHKTKLRIMRLLHPREQWRTEGCVQWEAELTKQIGFYEQYLIERRKPVRYPNGVSR
jgi:GT2 family glycosyltransferase